MLFIKVFSGWLSDRLGRRKPLVLLGYGLAAAVKPLFPVADSVAAVTIARLLDRSGKGIRGAPRDALLGDLAPADIRGACFGLRQSMDTVGAVLGPLAAVGLLWMFADALSPVLWFATIPGFVAVALLAFKVHEPKGEHARPVRLPISRQGLASLGKSYWKVIALGAVVSLARLSEAFLVLRALDLGVKLTFVPAVLVVMSVVYAITAWPAGALSDRMPRYRLLGLGMLVLAIADVMLAKANGPLMFFSGVALTGLHFGLVEGVMASLIADTAPARHRGSAFGVFNLVAGIGLLLAGAIGGLLWDLRGPEASFAFAAGVALLAGLLTLVLRHREA